MISVTLEKSCNQKPVQSLVLLTERKGQNSQKQSGTCRNSKKLYSLSVMQQKRETKQKSLSSKIPFSLFPSFLFTSLAASCSLATLRPHSLFCTEFSSQSVQTLQVRNFAWFGSVSSHLKQQSEHHRYRSSAKKNMLMTNKQL